MNPEIKQQWVAALRSGDYKQTGSRLKSPNGFCCLGVLCDLHHMATGSTGWTKATGDRKGGFAYTGDFIGILPPAVRDWAELTWSNPRLVVDDTRHPITELNDDLGYNFKQLAKLIEDQL